MCLEDNPITDRKATSKKTAVREAPIDFVYSGIILVRVCITVKKYYDRGNSYKGKHLTGWLMLREF